VPVGQGLNRASADLIGKVPPQNLEAEQAVLGGIFLKPGIFAEVVDVLTEEDFYSPAHALVFRACQELFRKGAPTDMIAVADLLQGQGRLEEAGGVPFFASLVETPVSAANAVYHARIVKEKSVQRRLIQTAVTIITSCMEGGKDVAGLLDEAEQAIFAISESRVTRTYTSSKDLVKSVFLKLEDLFNRKELVTGVRTGYQKLDELTAGLQPSDLVIIAGRPSMKVNATSTTPSRSSRFGSTVM